MPKTRRARVWSACSAAVVVGLLLCAAAPLAAQPSPRIERLEAAVWPEFDRQAALVIYRARLAADTPVPSLVTIPIPAAVGEPHAVAWRGPVGTLLVAQSSRRVEGEWAFIDIVAAGLDLQLEFYSDLAIDGANRRFELVWPGGAEISQFGYEIQQPAEAAGMSIEPPALETRLGTDGLSYFRGTLGPVAPQQEVRLVFEYTKQSSGLTAEWLKSQAPPAAAPVTPPAVPPAAQAAAAPAPSSGGMNWIFISIIAVLLVLVVVLLARSSGGDQSSTPPSAG